MKPMTERISLSKLRAVVNFLGRDGEARIREAYPEGIRDKIVLKLVKTRTFGNGNVLLTYEPAR